MVELNTSSMMALAVALLKIGDVMGLAVLLTRLEAEKLLSGELGGLMLVSRDDPNNLSWALTPLLPDFSESFKDIIIKLTNFHFSSVKKGN